jgi:hypothetical protein
MTCGTWWWISSGAGRKRRKSAPDDSSTGCRPGTPLTREDAVRLIQTYVDHYNTIRLHSAIGYVTPHDMLAGRQAEIHAARDRKLEQARQQRQLLRAARSLLAHSSNTTTRPRQVKQKRALQGCNHAEG